ncbi:class I SAM-dependent methyltransferase [Wenjunlia tyrosinilytica]|uniref:O-methyltransferase n=1 Tax=Wenjunlia tyrosinilytica TaxID=1544741 RepID=A0A917ZKW6_9ACTN|nr:class I SAM-dependent methyltransferase [Wenjunlia tyrosinilytica]GGO84084.1 O-methyltransferase [Wenjunlia tyrosinilytica]
MRKSEPDRIRPELEGVPETLLWTLYYRAVEARRPDSVIDDPKAVELVEALDYPFEERFGGPSAFLGQLQALRALSFDNEVRRFLDLHPDGTVAALGEGLETQFRRVDNGRVHWVTVDLPETVELRRRLLPEQPRQRFVAASVLEEGWTDGIDTSRGLLITAQGLLMYLRPPEVRGLLSACAERFPGAGMVLDAVPRWFSAASRRGVLRTAGYTPPRMPWGIDADERHRLREAHPRIAEVRDVELPRGRGLFFGTVAPLLLRLPVARSKRPSVTALRFAA